MALQDFRDPPTYILRDSDNEDVLLDVSCQMLHFGWELM